MASLGLRPSEGVPATRHCTLPTLTLFLSQQGQLDSPHHPTSSWAPLDQLLGLCLEEPEGHLLPLLQVDPDLQGSSQEKMYPKSNLQNPHSGQRSMRNKDHLQM